METTIFLCRHGETDWNKENRFQGATGTSDLSDTGKKQAHLLGERLKDYGIELIFSSKAKRNLHTADIVSEETSISVIIVDELRERSLGILEGKTRLWYKEHYPESFKIYQKTKDMPGIEGAESVEEVAERSLKAIQKIVEENKGENIAIINHRGFIKSFIFGLTGKSAADINQDNCCINVIKYNGKGFKVEKINETGHLTGIA